ncbi:MAG: PAS domain-containing protein, partial [Ferruginibacter sp.]
KKLEEQITLQENLGEIFTVAAKLSFDVIWDWNLLTNEGSIGEGFKEMFGHTIYNNKGIIADWNIYIYPDDKEIVEKSLQDAIASSETRWEHVYRFIKADCTVAKIFNRATIIRNTNGKALRMIGAIQDISKQKVLEERLEQEIATKGKLLTDFKESFNLIFNSSTDVLYDADLEANTLIVSDAFEKEFGYKTAAGMTLEKDWASHIHPDDKARILKKYTRLVATSESEWKADYRFLKADGTVANVLNKGIVLRNPEGKAYRMMGSIHDISKQKVLEERLEQEIKLKEKQIAEAAEDAKYTERSDIGKELHDNINQLLGASRLYLELAKRGGEQSKLYLSRSTEYTITAIEEIRRLTKGMTTDIVKNIGLCEAIEKIASDFMEVNPVKIFSTLDSFIENRVNDKFKLNVFRIVQEQLNNILKHAQAKKVTISLSQNKKNVILCITDNGIGFNTTEKRKGIGVDNIISRAAAYGGTAEFVSARGEGCILTVKFIVTAALLKNA